MEQTCTVPWWCTSVAVFLDVRHFGGKAVISTAFVQLLSQPADPQGPLHKEECSVAFTSMTMPLWPKEEPQMELPEAGLPFLHPEVTQGIAEANLLRVADFVFLLCLERPIATFLIHQK